MSVADINPRRPLQSPDQLNRAIKLTKPSSWLLLAVLGLCIGSIIAWGFFGRLTVYVEGQGVLALEGGIDYDIRATATGTISAVLVELGQTVERGDGLFTIDQQELAARRAAAQASYQSQQQEFERYKTESDQDVDRRRSNLDKELKSLNADLASQKVNEEQLQQIYSSQQDLIKRGLTTQPQVQDAFQALVAVQQSIREINDRLATLQLDQVEFEDQVNKNQADLQISVINAEGAVKDIDAQIEFGGTISSPSAGLVTEVTTEVSALVNAGDELATIESGENALIVRGYLPIGKGKQVEPGMTAEVSPTSVERNIYGSARGTVVAVSRLPLTEPALMNVIGNQALVDQLMATGAPIEVRVILEKDPNTESGFRWTSSAGPPVQLTAGTTADVRVETRRRRPIALVIPVLQTWFGNE
ncbi:MAG: NHLP bacteriocin system secretion protein [Pseudomonadota bacterium]